MTSTGRLDWDAPDIKIGPTQRPVDGHHTSPIGARSKTTVAITDRGVVLFDTKGLRCPTRIRERFDALDVLGAINDTDGDSWIQVDGTKYWIEGIWSSQLYVIRQLKRRTA